MILEKRKEKKRKIMYRFILIRIYIGNEKLITKDG